MLNELFPVIDSEFQGFFMVEYGCIAPVPPVPHQKIPSLHMHTLRESDRQWANEFAVIVLSQLC